jgi:hypothetical protein
VTCVTQLLFQKQVYCRADITTYRLVWPPSLVIGTCPVP